MSEKRKIMGWNQGVRPRDGFYWIKFNIDLPPSLNWISYFEEAKSETLNPRPLRAEIKDRYLLIGVNSEEDVNEELKQLAYSLVEKTNDLLELREVKVEKIKESELLEKKKKEKTKQKIEKKIREVF